MSNFVSSNMFVLIGMFLIIVLLFTYISLCKHNTMTNNIIDEKYKNDIKIERYGKNTFLFYFPVNDDGKTEKDNYYYTIYESGEHIDFHTIHIQLEKSSKFDTSFMNNELKVCDDHPSMYEVSLDVTNLNNKKFESGYILFGKVTFNDIDVYEKTNLCRLFNS